MKIKPAKAYLPVPVSTPHRAAGAGRGAAPDARYDQLSISSAAARDRGGFREMAALLSYQVRTYNTTGKIQELRRQVSSGEYQIEPRETAARMLLLAEEDE